MHRWLLPACILLLCLVSIITLKSVAPVFASQQLFFVVLSCGVFYITSQISYRFWLQFHWMGYIILVISLIVTLIFGAVTRGSSRWITIGDFITIQPSQLAIPLAGLTLSWLSYRFKYTSLKPLLLFFIFTLIPGILILIAPDLGTTLVYIFSVGSVLFVGELPWRSIGMLSVFSLIAMIISWNLVLHPYQKARITSFLGNDPTSQASYNAHQALIAVGSGQMWGRGIGQGSQSHLRFLPERQTDFVFASLAEEWGFIGSVFVVLLYAIIIVHLLINSLVLTNPVAQYYCVIAAAMFFIQSFINMGMNMGLLPITGVTLPYISYGGSSMVSISFMIGIIYNMMTEYQPRLQQHFT